MSSDVVSPSARERARTSTRPAVFGTVRLRMVHAYLSAFIAPTVVFFALSGALQVLDLHEAHGSYTPPAFLTAIARLHKDQVFAPSRPRPTRPSGAASGGAPGGPPGGSDAPTPLATQTLKALFVAEALTLAVTTVLGAWIGIAHAKRARRFVVVLVAGAVIPVVLLVV